MIVRPAHPRYKTFPRSPLRVGGAFYAGLALGFALGTIGRWPWYWSTALLWVPIALGLSVWIGLGLCWIVRLAWWEWR